MIDMTEPFYVGAYWGPRAELVDSCAERLTACLQGLRSASHLLGSWYEKTNRRSEAKRRPVDVSHPNLKQLLAEGVNRRDTGGAAIVELGFSVGLWNGQSKVPVGLHLTCGASTTRPGVMNSFVLDLPVPEGEGTQLYELATARRLVEAVAATWDPDWATLTSYSLHDALDPAARQPVLGWITYLSGRRPVPPHVSSARVEPSGDGTLVLCADSVEAVDASALQQLAADLENVGSLGPTPSTEAPS